MSRTSKLLAAVAIAAATLGRAASTEAALSQRGRQNDAPAVSRPLPRPVQLEERRGRGLVLPAWINGAGPFTFAVDTGAGGTILSRRVASAARVSVNPRPGPAIAGLSGTLIAANDAVVKSIAIGEPQNILPADRNVIVSAGLPPDLDGLLDPTDAFGSFGYVLDIPGRQLSAFDPKDWPVTADSIPSEGAVVPWLREGRSDRPFVMLDTGEKALIDTGSGLGFVVSSYYRPDRSTRTSAVYDVGGSVSVRRIAPRTIAVGALVLRNVPTDVISGAAANTPALLGLAALRPFRLRFDPLNRLIEFAPADR